jgi:serine/threonine-protein kinase HipA
MSELLILVDGKVIGRVLSEAGGRLSLHYEDSWVDIAGAHSLSASMPLGRLAYRHKLVRSFLWNLLPENPNVLRRWAQQYRVSEANPFKLLAYVGADVPGAAQFVPPERLEEIQSEHQPTIQWMNEDEFADRLRELRTDVAALRRPKDIGKMSLPGAQAKTAFYRDERTKQWGIPGGRTPTTHIIKPCIPGFDGLVENEYLCLNIANAVGLPAASSHVIALDEPYIVVERYDRLPPKDGSPFMQRVHQEDLCQALGIMPTEKYQEQGGPGIAEIVTLLRRVSANPDSDVDLFVQANAFNWFIGGTDAHAKNYSLLIGAGDEMRLAPLYDLSSQLPYPDLIEQRVAMKIGDNYRISRIGVEDWRKLARKSDLDEGHVLTMITNMARELPDRINDCRTRAPAERLNGDVITTLADKMIEHVNTQLSTITTTYSGKKPL